MQARKVYFLRSVRDEATQAAFVGGEARSLAPAMAERFVASGHAEYADLDDANATEGAKELARDTGVPLTGVEGSGAGGRVTKQDVEAKTKKEES